MSMFGELRIDSSRVVSDDEDEDQLEQQLNKIDENQKRKIYWLTDEDTLGKTKVDELIIADGIASCAYIHTYLLSHLTPTDLKLIGLTGTLSDYKIYQTNRETPIASSDQKGGNVVALSKMRTNFIYLFNLNGVSYALALLFNQIKTAVESYDWIDQFVKHVEFKKLLVITEQDRTAYFGPEIEREQFPLVKYMSSDKTARPATQHACSPLNSPNFLHHLPAALIQYCVLKNNNISFLAFVCYTAFIRVDINSIKAIGRATKSMLGENSVFLDNEKARNTLRSLERLITPADAMYM